MIQEGNIYLFQLTNIILQVMDTGCSFSEGDSNSGNCGKHIPLLVIL